MVATYEKVIANAVSKSFTRKLSLADVSSNTAEQITTTY